MKPNTHITRRGLSVKTLADIWRVVVRSLGGYPLNCAAETFERCWYKGTLWTELTLRKDRKVPLLMSHSLPHEGDLKFEDLWGTKVFFSLSQTNGVWIEISGPGVEVAKAEVAKELRLSLAFVPEQNYDDAEVDIIE